MRISCPMGPITCQIGMARSAWPDLHGMAVLIVESDAGTFAPLLRSRLETAGAQCSVAGAIACCRRQRHLQAGLSDGRDQRMKRSTS
jgi:hypothetical protein